VIVGGAWLLPVATDPIPRGGVVLRGTLVHEVGVFADLVSAYPDEATEFFDGCVITPGLVNAHTHLSLTVLRGLIPRGGLADWLPNVTKAILAMGEDEFAASAALGAIESLAAGVTLVGDIAYGPEAPAAAGDAGLAGVFYWEVLGIDASDLDRALDDAEFPRGDGARTSGRTRRGISPHSPYTSGPALLKAARAEARELGAPFAIHVAESPDESALMHTGSGPFAHVAGRLARRFVRPGTSSVAYLDGLGVLEDALAVHCVQLEAGDAGLLASKARGVALCPRSNEYLRNGAPPVSALRVSGATLCLGTDSAASNEDLDLLAEARALRALDPSLRPDRLLRIVTLEGARALGADDEFGSLEPGKQADLAVFEVGPTRDPVEAVLRDGGSATLQAVMTAGVWRIRRQRHTVPLHGIERAADDARTVVAEALARP
jgi:aminodeoxyfutalosine deaminase